MAVLQELKDASSLRDLAKILGYKPKALSYIVYKIPEDQKYQTFAIPKRFGGEREVCAPTDSLKRLQRQLARALYDCRDEIDSGSGQRSLSHGFRRNHSIVTNARQHKRRRYVLNLDLQDFFPAFNFGRVRGFFISNNNFKLSEKVSTVIAQIACFDNSLPQGSPSSPAIADLIAHLLDVRLAQLAKRHKLTYSRYADDITFSTSQKRFPNSVALPIASGGGQWKIGDKLSKEINRAGFTVNAKKTRMQFRISRQIVTGLTVNDKVNIRPEYYRSARAMCHNLFQTGVYHRPISSLSAVCDSNGEQPALELIESLNPIEGILNHIHYVKDMVDVREEIDKRKYATAARRLYAKFLKYRYFVRLEQPLIVCEGKTDSTYLKCAIRMLTQFQPQLGSWEGELFRSKISFFNYNNSAHRILELNGGTGDLRYFFVKNKYRQDIQSFGHRPLKCPVIVLIDNDDGAKDIFATIRKNYGKTINFTSSEQYFRVTENLYLVKTPELGGGGKSHVECFFEPSLLRTKLEGKMFNQSADMDPETEYGKAIFAERVVRPNATKIKFDGFMPLLARVVAAIEDYSPPVS